jgi:hypothetical protein
MGPHGPSANTNGTSLQMTSTFFLSVFGKVRQCFGDREAQWSTLFPRETLLMFCHVKAEGGSANLHFRLPSLGNLVVPDLHIPSFQPIK